MFRFAADVLKEARVTELNCTCTQPSWNTALEGLDELQIEVLWRRPKAVRPSQNMSNSEA